MKEIKHGQHLSHSPDKYSFEQVRLAVGEGARRAQGLASQESCSASPSPGSGRHLPFVEMRQQPPAQSYYYDHDR